MMGDIVKVWNVVSCFLLKMSALIGTISMSMCVLQVSYLAVSLPHFVLSNTAASSLCLSTSCFRVPHITRVRNIVLNVSLCFCVEPKALCFFCFSKKTFGLNYKCARECSASYCRHGSQNSL